MDTKYKILIFVIAVIVLSIPLKCMLDNREGFGTYNGYYKQYSENCSGLDRYACDRAYNCGVATELNGYSYCTAGSSRGPYFAEPAYWTYKGASDIYFPQTHRFPMIYTNSLYPYSKIYSMKSINK